MTSKQAITVVGGGTAIIALSLLISLLSTQRAPETPNTAAIGDTLNQGLVAYWKLDETSGTSVADSSGNSYTGIMQSTQGTPPSPRPGKIGSSLWFDGTDDSITASRPLSSATNSTIALWVYVPSWTEKGSFVKIGDQNGIALGVGAGNFGSPGNELIGLHEGKRWIPSGKSVNPGGWHHVAMTINSFGVTTFYVDGGTGSSFQGEAPLTPTGGTSIGGYVMDGAPRYFKGQLDDVRIYNRVLSAEEIGALSAGIIAPASVTTTTNGSPTALSATALTLESTPITVTLNGRDPENDQLSVTITANPLHGALSNYRRVTDSQFQYTYWPTTGFVGKDTFYFRVTDGTNSSAPAGATVSVNAPGAYNPPEPVAPPPAVVPPPVVVQPPVVVVPAISVNYAPVVSNSSALTFENTPITVNIAGSDRNTADPLSMWIESQPAHGALSNYAKINNGEFHITYWPTAGFVGTDSFTYKLYDRAAYSNIGRATLTVNTFGQPTTPVINPPVIPPVTIPDVPVQPPVVPVNPLPAGVTDSYPLSAHLFKLNPAQRDASDRNMSLQTALETYRTLRLEIGDYSAISGPITIRSGYKLYGLPGTKTPAIIVEPGTRNALVSRVSAGTLSFPASNSVTSNNVFAYFMYTGIEINNARLENNLFLDFNYSKLTANTSGSGYLRNNRFVRFRAHGGSQQVVMKGDSARSSYGNVFLGFNFLTPAGATTDIDNQRDVTFVGGDAESWNYDRISSDALIKVRSSGQLSVFGLQGGGGRSGIYDVAADEVRIMGSYINTSSGQDLTIGSQTNRLLLANHDQRNINDVSRIPQVFRVLEDALGDDPRYNGTTANGALPSAGQTALRAMLGSSQGAQWEPASYEPIADPLGPGWDNSLYSKPDRTQYLQDLINSNSIVPPGTYYISSPLRLDSSHMLWGSGENTTIIVAKSRIDMIVSSAHRDTEAYNGIKVIVGDITLQGGRNGIHLDAAGAGRYAQLTDAVISHVTMRNMENAGIYVDGIYAIDNVLFDNIKVVNSGTGIKQTPAGCQGGDNPGISYIDKMNVYQGQFVGNQIGFDFPACRPNNANICINCLFKDNAIAAVRMESNNLPVFANSDFINNGGTASQPTISNKNNTGNWSSNIVIVGSRFKPGNATALLGAYRIDVEGTLFERGNNASARVVAGGVKASFYNSNSAIDAGPIQNGVSLNTLFPSGTLRNIAVYIRNGAQTILIPGTPTPEGQLLRGVRF